MRRRHFLLLGLIAGMLGILLSGCVYRPDVQQGNIIKPSDMRIIEKGMTSSQVKSLLGDPLLVNIYRDNRVVYVYTFQRSHHRMKEKRLIIYLRNDRVTSYSYDDKLSGSPAR